MKPEIKALLDACEPFERDPNTSDDFQYIHAVYTAREFRAVLNAAAAVRALGEEKGETKRARICQHADEVCPWLLGKDCDCPLEGDKPLAKRIGDMIHDHTMANFDFGPLGYDNIANQVIAEVRRAQSPTPHGGEGGEPIDFCDLADAPTLNPRWQPDLQELVYSAISYVRGDYEDADENNGEQTAERLLIALRSALFPQKAQEP